MCFACNITNDIRRYENDYSVATAFLEANYCSKLAKATQQNAFTYSLAPYKRYQTVIS